MAVDSAPITIEALRAEHWPGVARVYEEGIATRNATFETEVPAWEAWDASHLTEHRFVALRDTDVVGWAAVSPVSGRCCYQGVVENSVYVAESSRGQGIGRALLERLLESADRAGFWTVQASVFADNAASIEFHKRCGFRVVGTRVRIAQLDGVWRDTVLLERRRP